jgi:hypothetical protein
MALYARPKHPGTYHYALFITPKTTHGQAPITKHHVKNTLQVDVSGEAIQPWRYERTIVSNLEAEQRLLVRIIIAKVLKPCDDVQRILESVPVHQVDDLDQAKAQSFTCRTWIRDAWQELMRQGAITAQLEDWEDVEREALEYLDRKREQKRWDSTWKGGTGAPLMDLLEGKEVVE